MEGQSKGVTVSIEFKQTCHVFSKEQNKKDRPKTRNNENGSLLSFLNNNISKGRNGRRDQRFTS